MPFESFFLLFSVIFCTEMHENSRKKCNFARFLSEAVENRAKKEKVTNY